jgi:hypothetical protein
MDACLINRYAVMPRHPHAISGILPSEAYRRLRRPSTYDAPATCPVV